MPQLQCVRRHDRDWGLGFAAPGQDIDNNVSGVGIRRKLAGAADGDRQTVDILIAVLSYGLPAVDAACLEALREGVLIRDALDLYALDFPTIFALKDEIEGEGRSRISHSSVLRVCA